MRVLSVADRELRAAARQRGMYRLRWITAAGALVLLVWLGWGYDVFQNRSVGPDVFQAFSVVIFFYCLFVGAATTADCLSSERREGTLGLLFLTNLNSAEIVAGKLCANGLALIYSLLAVSPMLALPVLVGGVTFDQFWRVVLALVNALFFSIAAGFVASAFSVRQFPAVASATGLALILGAGLLGMAEVLRDLGIPRSLTNWVAAFCPLQTLLVADGNRRFGGWSQYWISLVVVAGMSWTWLLLTVWRVGRTWRDRPKKVRIWSRFRFGERIRERGRAGRTALRHRLLEINPFFWLAGRQRVSAPIFMVLTVVLVLITVGLTTPYFGRLIPGGANGAPMVGHLIAWVWTALAIHALVLCYGATVASQRLAEDKQTGALELILSTPTTTRSISRGLWLAYGRRMFFPALIAALVHVYFIWQVLTLMLLDPPGGRLPPAITPGKLFWSSVFDQPFKGQALDWQFGFILRSLAIALAVLVAHWFMLGWLARWLGLRMKRPGFAPMVAIVLTLVPPLALFSLVCYVGAEWQLFRLPERQLLPLMTWVAVGIAMGNCLLLSAWAAFRLHRDFRTTVTSRYDPPSPRRWWPSWRTLLRFAAGATALAVLLVLTIGFFYGYQNWQGRKKWAAFQTQLKQRGESLELASVLPGPVSDEQNFAQSPAFQNILNPTRGDKAAAALLRESLKQSAIDPMIGPGVTSHAPWMQQIPVSFDQHVAWSDPKYIPGSTPDRPKLAAAVWDGLKPLQADLNAVASATDRPLFQVTTNRTAAAVYESNRRELVAMEQLHFLFQVRAEALIVLNRGEEAGADVMTSLRLAGLAAQSPDLKSSLRVQVMLARSLQPIWEGLAQHDWNESQLTAFQNELASFDLLANHTNAIHHAVLAHIEVWRAIPDSGKRARSVPQSGGVYVQRPGWKWQPGVWWYDNCEQLYHAGRNAVARVDATAGRVVSDFNWSDFNGLPLDGVATQLFQQAPWWGSKLSLVSLAQTAVNQGVIACALERYRLARGAYPESLEQLLPAYLNDIPRDISRGRPMFYQRDDQGGYVLRGAGFNGTIDAGTAASDDWLWAFTTPTNKPPTGARRN